MSGSRQILGPGPAPGTTQILDENGQVVIASGQNTNSVVGTPGQGIVEPTMDFSVEEMLGAGSGLVTDQLDVGPYFDQLPEDAFINELANSLDDPHVRAGVLRSDGLGGVSDALQQWDMALAQAMPQAGPMIAQGPTTAAPQVLTDAVSGGPSTMLPGQGPMTMDPTALRELAQRNQTPAAPIASTPDQIESVDPAVQATPQVDIGQVARGATYPGALNGVPIVPGQSPGVAGAAEHSMGTQMAAQGAMVNYLNNLLRGVRAGDPRAIAALQQQLAALNAQFPGLDQDLIDAIAMQGAASYEAQIGRADTLDQVANAVTAAEARRISDREAIAAEVEGTTQALMRDLDRYAGSTLAPSNLFSHDRGMAGLSAAVGIAVGAGLAAYQNILYPGANAQNTALRLVESAIERDIQAQRHVIERDRGVIAGRQSVLGALYQQLGDHDLASQITRSIQYEIAAKRVEALLARGQGNLDVGKARQLIAELRMRSLSGQRDAIADQLRRAYGARARGMREYREGLEFLIQHGIQAPEGMAGGDAWEAQGRQGLVNMVNSGAVAGIPVLGNGEVALTRLQSDPSALEHLGNVLRDQDARITTTSIGAELMEMINQAREGGPLDSVLLRNDFQGLLQMFAVSIAYPITGAPSEADYEFINSLMNTNVLSREGTVNIATGAGRDYYERLTRDITRYMDVSTRSLNSHLALFGLGFPEYGALSRGRDTGSRTAMQQVTNQGTIQGLRARNERIAAETNRQTTEIPAGRVDLEEWRRRWDPRRREQVATNPVERATRPWTGHPGAR